MSMLDLEFARNAQNLRDGIGHPPACADGFTKVVSEVFDELATNQSWSATKAENLALMNTIQPSRGTAVVAAARDEGVNFLEWLAHHRAVGFEHVFVYTNANRDGSDALYELLAQNGLITYIQNETGAIASPQVKAYEHSIHFLHELRDFEWVAYLDIDEFFVPSRSYDYSICNLLQALKQTHPDSSPGAVCFNWDWYGSSGTVMREPGLVQDRFKYSTPHPLVKSVIRLADVKSMRCIHIPEFNSHVVNSAFKPIDVSDYMINPPEFSGGKVNHYYHKSFEEFGVKRDRGEGSSAGGQTGKDVETFFVWNIQSNSETFSPMPEVLRQRVQVELQRLLSVNQVADTQSEIEKRYQKLALSVNGTDLIGTYNALKQKFLPNNWQCDFRVDSNNVE